MDMRLENIKKAIDTILINATSIDNDRNELLITAKKASKADIVSSFTCPDCGNSLLPPNYICNNDSCDWRPTITEQLMMMNYDKRR